MVKTRYVFEWFAGINWIILRSQIPVLPLAPLTRRGKTKFATAIIEFKKKIGYL